MGFTDRFNRIVRIVGDNQQTIINKNAVVLSGTTPAMGGGSRKSDQLDQMPVRTGNEYPAPSTPEEQEVGSDPHKRYQDIATSHLSEGPTPGRIWRLNQARANAKLGDSMAGNPDGSIGLLLGITGNDAGGLGSAMYIPHTKVIRGAGHAASNFRTIDDGAMVPGVFVADPTRR